MAYHELFPRHASERLSHVLGSLSPILDALPSLSDMQTAFIDPNYSPPRFYLNQEGTFYSHVIELAGYKREQVNVEIDGDELTISASRPCGQSRDGVKMGLGTSCPRIPLPSDADLSQIEAKMEEGLLTLTIPRIAQPAPRKVTVS